MAKSSFSAVGSPFSGRLSAVLAGDTSQQQAESLAAQLELPLAASREDFDFFLTYVDHVLQLQKSHSGIGGVYADFVSGKVGHRFRFGGGKGQLIARAVGLKKGQLPEVLDLTAGLGRDGFVLASLGCSVRLLERSPIVAALLQDGLQRAAEDAGVAEVIERMQLIQADSIHYLQNLQNRQTPDVCYLDPMYPHTKKSALPGKEMLLFREVVGEDLDSGDVLALARKVASKRVVVKRPRKADYLAGEKADFQMFGKSTRYDIYLPDIPLRNP
ncbi:MAG: class I SAM-dependent methyltransferase [Gammaproteobacteria bacterium]|jgi:16S rRNA (guanine1516-N2)-methyltransferase|nr:class I SAM-dependent methyltransferase [Gammaproteobacteria bacterium]MBT3489766.1 class I SAM-dependent methyltransferase [Gammaproteobacteria bacterium]MBT3719727.1 class I SAM-dependent methyltransferase [Gammaproteobacteria bacterium]MBT3845501.1 class I SAM-dependent methyltransferase [Gammaproteobacteria bacterium]MBT3892904.1 class I SAM-dependent methyltransferase [Gammaproteobacteria bacterium]